MFAWTYDEMSGLDPGLVVHSLNVDLGIRPVVQPAKVFHIEEIGRASCRERVLVAV